MPAQGNRIKKVRQAVGSGVLQALGSRPTGEAEDHVHARARTEKVCLTERYTYDQEISRNSSRAIREAPSGSIEMTVPYDGHEFFTQQACADVAIGIQRTPPHGVSVDALIGYLLLANYGRTDLSEVLKLGHGYGSVPIRVPVAGPGSPGGQEELSADRQACVITYDYAPDPAQLRVVPISVEVDLFDPDSVNLSSVDILDDDEPRLIDAVSKKITQQVSFRPFLMLCLTVRVNLPRRRDQGRLIPTVSQVALDWPTITSLRALHLQVHNREVPIRYNPITRSIEWSDIDMHEVKTSDSKVIAFESDIMFLFIEQPGELYEQVSLDGRVEVKIPEYLISGVEAKVADGIGAIPSGRQPTITSYISTHLELILDDAFAKRMLSPYQHLHFDEVIPDQMRISDIFSALEDRGFTVEVRAQRPPEWLLYAKRPEGPDEMELWLFVMGKKFTTERENKLAGDYTFKSTFDSGDLKVFIYGSLRRDSRELTHEMNALQRALRERFDHVRASR